jgi:hypothetical protein
LLAHVSFNLLISGGLMNRAHVMTGGRYPVLRTLGILYILGAAAVLCYGVYIIGWTLFAAPASMGDRFRVTLQALAATFFGVITILALAELIKLVIDIEHNTRVAAMRGMSTTDVAAMAGSTTATATAGMPVGDSSATHVNRINELDEESAEGALLRGH